MVLQDWIGQLYSKSDSGFLRLESLLDLKGLVLTYFKILCVDNVKSQCQCLGNQHSKIQSAARLTRVGLPPLFGLNGYVPSDRVWFSGSWILIKQGMQFRYLVSSTGCLSGPVALNTVWTFVVRALHDLHVSVPTTFSKTSNSMMSVIEKYFLYVKWKIIE